jgi:alpha-1,2-mannosyltransferase
MLHGRRLPKAVSVTLLVALVAAFGWYCAARSIDFPLYHQAGVQILQGDYELYPPGVYDGLTPVPRHGFRYAPGIALLFVPFALLPLEAAAFAFFALKLAAFIATFMLIAPLVDMRGRVGPLILAALLVAGGYVVEEFRNGNAHFLVTWLMVLAFARAERGESLVPGTALALAIATKIAPLGQLAYFGLRRAWTLCATTVIVLTAIWLIPSALWGFSTTMHLTGGFVRYTFLKADEPLPMRNYSLRGALIKLASGWLSPDAITAIWICAVVVAVVACLWVMGAAKVQPGRRALELALIVTAMPLLSPQTQRIHFSSLAVPAAILWALIRLDRTLPFRRFAIAALGVNAAVATFLPVVLPSRRLARAYIDLSPYTFATLGLFMALLVTAIGLKNREESEKG